MNFNLEWLIFAVWWRLKEFFKDLFWVELLLGGFWNEMDIGGYGIHRKVQM